MFAKLFKSSVQVKPVRANDDDSGWLVVTETPLSAFLDECWRYGLRVAWYNFKIQML
jgi:hypothetical protein